MALIWQAWHAGMHRMKEERKTEVQGDRRGSGIFDCRGEVETSEAISEDFYFIKEDAVCYQENDIMLGLKFLHDLALEKGMPIVYCLALGTSLGGHEDAIASGTVRCLTESRTISGGGRQENEAAERHESHSVGSVLTDKEGISGGEIKWISPMELITFPMFCR